MSNLEKIRKPKLVPKEYIHVAIIAAVVMICVYVFSMITDDIRTSVTATFGFSALALAFSNMRQMRVNKLLLEKIDNLENSASD